MAPHGNNPLYGIKGVLSRQRRLNAPLIVYSSHHQYDTQREKQCASHLHTMQMSHSKVKFSIQRLWDN